jgi:hypothetical protein
MANTWSSNTFINSSIDLGSTRLSNSLAFTNKSSTCFNVNSSNANTCAASFSSSGVLTVFFISLIKPSGSSVHLSLAILCSSSLDNSE